MSNLRPVDLLVVDDDDEIRKRSVQYFESKGYDTSSAANGNDALELAKQRVFHVAILDMSMPGMSGIELLEKLRQCKIQLIMYRL